MKERSRRALGVSLVASLVLAGACSDAPPTKDAPPPGPHAPVANRELLHDLRDVIVAEYDARLAAEGYLRTGRTAEQETAAARETERAARDKLARALEGAGVKDAATADRDKLAAYVLRDALRSGRYALILAEPDPSFAIVHVAGAGRQERAIEVFGEKFAYERTLFDEVVVPDYPTYRAGRIAGPNGAATRHALLFGRSIFLDVTAGERIAREAFFPKVDAYRALAARAATDDAPFLELSDPRALPRLLTLVKDVLRWRSLEGFWSSIRAFPMDERTRRFAEDYVAREEVRAAIEACFLERAALGKDPRAAGEALALVERRAALAAIVHGEPLGEVATIVGLAAVAARDEATPDAFARAVLRAAAGNTAALVREIAERSRGGVANADADPARADARALAAVARATPDELRAAARAIYDRLPAMVSSATSPPR